MSHCARPHVLVTRGPSGIGVRSWIERNRLRYASDGFGRCAVVLRWPFPHCALPTIQPSSISGTPSTVVRLKPQGIATEAAEAWRDYAFTRLGLDRIVSMVSRENVASRRVAEKLGMAVERSAVWDGQPMLMYSRSNPGAAARAVVRVGEAS